MREFTSRHIEKARELGCVTTLLGRRRYIPDINSGNRNFRLFAERAAVNMPIQGTAADMIKLAMIRSTGISKPSGVASEMLLQVHDELLFEVPPDELAFVSKLVREGHGHAYQMRVPIKVDVKAGKNWSEMDEHNRSWEFVSGVPKHSNQRTYEKSGACARSSCTVD